MTANLYGLVDFEVQTWDGRAWVTVPNGAVTGNDRVANFFSFPEITTTRVRVLVHHARSHFSRVVEVEALGCNAP